MRPFHVFAFVMIFAALPLLGQAEDSSLHQRDLVIAKLDNQLVIPETALWRWAPLKPYLGSVKLVCGEVNYESSTRKYQGYHRFYALVDSDRVTLAQIEDARQDPSGRLKEKLDDLCGTNPMAGTP